MLGTWFFRDEVFILWVSKDACDFSRLKMLNLLILKNGLGGLALIPNFCFSSNIVFWVCLLLSMDFLCSL